MQLMSGAGHNLLLKSKRIKLSKYKSVGEQLWKFFLHMNQSFHSKVVRCELLVWSLDAVRFESHVVFSPSFSSRNNNLSHCHEICARFHSPEVVDQGAQRVNENTSFAKEH